MAVFLNGEEWEVGQTIMAEVDLVQVAQADQCITFHSNNMIIEEKQFLHSHKLLEVMIIHLVQLIGGKVKVAQTACVSEGSRGEAAQVVVGQPQGYKMGKTSEAAFL